MGSKFRGEKSEELCEALPAECHLVTVDVISRVSPEGSSQLREAGTQMWESPVPVGASTTLVGPHAVGHFYVRITACSSMQHCNPLFSIQNTSTQGEMSHLPAILPYLLNKYPGKKRTTSATQKSTSPFSTFHIQLLAMK